MIIPNAIDWIPLTFEVKAKAPRKETIENVMRMAVAEFNTEVITSELLYGMKLFALPFFERICGHPVKLEVGFEVGGSLLHELGYYSAPGICGKTLTFEVNGVKRGIPV